MKKLAFVLLVTCMAGAVHAQSLSDQLDQTQQFIQQKSDDAQQSWQQNNPFSNSQPEENKGGPGQLPLPNFEQNQPGAGR